MGDEQGASNRRCLKSAQWTPVGPSLLEPLRDRISNRGYLWTDIHLHNNANGSNQPARCGETLRRRSRRQPEWCGRDDVAVH